MEEWLLNKLIEVGDKIDELTEKASILNYDILVTYYDGQNDLIIEILQYLKTQNQQ